MVNFKFKLAEVPISVSCCYLSTKARCRAYLIPEDEPTDIRIAITQADIEAERVYQSLKKKKNERLQTSTPEAVEILLLCRMASEALPGHGAVLFHGSALAFEGKGIAFTATSGTGKSTHAGLWRRAFGPRVVMVNDDKPFLSAKDGEIRIHGSPWQGKHCLGENTSVPVKAICILERGEENRIERISAREAMPMLLQQTYRPESPEMLLHTLRIMDWVSRGTKLYRLSCNMDEQAAWVACRGITLDDEEHKV